MLFGFFVAGLLYIFIKPSIIQRFLGKGKIRSVFMSALMGVPLPLCSCGVVPAAAGLHKQGASRGATLSFLISTPETGIDSIPVTYALLGSVMAIVRPVAAFTTAIIAGIMENVIGKTKTIDLNPSYAKNVEKCCCTSMQTNSSYQTRSETTGKRFYAGMKYAFIELLSDIGPWFLIGVLLAGVISSVIPDNFTDVLPGGRFTAMLVMLVAGIPLYICATSSTPVAAALVLKGLNPGAALVFLLAGPATNVASLTMVAKFLGRRSMAIYLGAIALCALAFGVLTDWVYLKLDVSAQVIVAGISDMIPPSVETAASTLLFFLIVNAVFQSYKEKHTCTCASAGNTEPSAG